MRALCMNPCLCGFALAHVLLLIAVGAWHTDMFFWRIAT